MTERILHWYGVTHGLRSVSLRYFNAAGASADSRIGEDWRQSLNLIPLVMKATLGRRPPVQVFGNDYPTPDGTCIRDYIHVDDLADAHVKALDYLAGGGESTALNVGTGERQQRHGGHRRDRAGHAVRRCRGRSSPRRAGDPVAVYADPTRAGETARLASAARPRRHHRVGVEVAQLAPRRLREHAFALTLTVEPAEQDGDGPRVEAQAMPGACESGAARPHRAPRPTGGRRPSARCRRRRRA